MPTKDMIPVNEHPENKHEPVCQNNLYQGINRSWPQNRTSNSWQPRNRIMVQGRRTPARLFDVELYGVDIIVPIPTALLARNNPCVSDFFQAPRGRLSPYHCLPAPLSLFPLFLIMFLSLCLVSLLIFDLAAPADCLSPQDCLPSSYMHLSLWIWTSVMGFQLDISFIKKESYEAHLLSS